jgi:hypothetical protein
MEIQKTTLFDMDVEKGDLDHESEILDETTNGGFSKLNDPEGEEYFARWRWRKPCGATRKRDGVEIVRYERLSSKIEIN